MKISRTSELTGNHLTMEIPCTQKQMDRFKTGVHAQVAFPNLSAGDREFIKTGITDAEWDNAFPEEEEEY
jgi:hypothetical protein